MEMTKRELLALGGAAVVALAIGVPSGDAFAKGGEVEKMISSFAGGKKIGTGKVTLTTPEIAENGNTVPVTVDVKSPMTDKDYVQSVMILAAGNPDVVLCERGIRSFDTSTRFTLDLNAIPVAKELTHLPVIVDPSHGTGRRSLVERMSLAALAAGADGLIVEVHPNPDSAACDASQTITPDTLDRIVRRGLAISEMLADEPVLTSVTVLSAD